MDPTGPWDRDRVDDYLSAARVPVRLGCRTPSDRPWTVALWFAWDPDRSSGAIRCATSADADLVDFVGHDDEVSFDVSTNDPPYAGVRGRGRATVLPDGDKDLLRSLLEQYLGGVDNPTGERLLRPEREEVEIRIEPERLHAWDYAGRMGSADE